MIQQAIEKASALIEALPYIQAFRGESVVVKFGGSILEENLLIQDIMKDVAFMECVGLRPVVVHGGGKAISARLNEKNIKAHFHHGLRVTDAATVEVVDQVLNYEVNPMLVDVIHEHACSAVGIHGNDIIKVKKHTDIDRETGEDLDWGFVGDVVSVDVGPILEAIENESVPVITPLGSDENGQTYNVNADAAAGAIARAIHARKLVFLSDVPGLLRYPDDPTSLISTLRLDEVESLIDQGVISGGMLPKVNGALRTLREGVRKAHIIDAGERHSLLLELFTDKGVGTEIILGEPT